ncbi:MAG: IclR family transcriptional regulator [Acidobacteriota bacterium]
MAATSSIGADATSSRALDKGLDILELIAAHGSAMSLAEVAERIHLGKASTLRLLRTLAAKGYIVRNDDDKDKYELLGDWPALSQRTLLGRLKEAAQPVMKSLHSELGETVSLAILETDYIRIADVLESNQHIRMSNYPGRVIQPYASSLGKAITAFQTDARIQRLLDVYGVYPLTRKTITGPLAIRAELADVRNNGYAFDREETVEGGICIGAPVFAGKDAVVAAVSVSTPKLRFTEAMETALPVVIRRAAAEMSRALGG